MATGKNGPVFILCFSRTGSTLLRYVIDTHPKIACPPEMHLCHLMDRLRLVHAQTAEFSAYQSAEQRSIYLQQKVQQTIDSIMSEYLKKTGKSIWCEKSIFTLNYFQTVKSCYPDARFICLYRNAFDQINSSIHAISRANRSANQYGMAAYINNAKGHIENGLADYWLDKSASLLNIEKNHQKISLRLRYEDLVGATENTIDELFQFLNLKYPPSLINEVFSQPHTAGPGDHKIHHTNTIHATSVSYNSESLNALISSDRLQKIGALHKDIGYPIR